MAEILLKPLGIDDAQDAAGLLAYLNPETPPEILAERLTEIFENHPHYHCVGAFSGATLIGLAGAWIATKIWCGKFLEIDNLVVHPGHRSSQIGTRLIQHLEGIAREQECKFVTLDSYVSNHPSHRLYHRLGFEIWGFHFVTPRVNSLWLGL